MTTFKAGDFVHVNGYGNGHVVFTGMFVDSFRDDQYRGTAVAFEDSGETVLVPTSRVTPGIRPYLYAIKKTNDYGALVDRRVYLGLLEAEERLAELGDGYHIVEIEAVLPWKKRD